LGHATGIGHHHLAPAQGQIALVDVASPAEMVQQELALALGQQRDSISSH
jgi:hypothetical protein